MAAAIIAFTIAGGVTGSLVAAAPIAAITDAVVAVSLWRRPIVVELRPTPRTDRPIRSRPAETPPG